MSFSSLSIALLLGPECPICCTSPAAPLDPALQPKPAAEGQELPPPMAEPALGTESELELDTEITVGLLASADELPRLLLASITARARFSRCSSRISVVLRASPRWPRARRRLRRKAKGSSLDMGKVVWDEGRKDRCLGDKQKQDTVEGSGTRRKRI